MTNNISQETNDTTSEGILGLLKAKHTSSKGTTAHPSKPTRKSVDSEASDVNKNSKYNFYYNLSPTTHTVHTFYTIYIIYTIPEQNTSHTTKLPSRMQKV